ncbi:MAG: S9 family peptidase [Caulobacterales bacterium]|nr:S9 family peptidase [Caulobacterales bacterium]
MKKAPIAASASALAGLIWLAAPAGAQTQAMTIDDLANIRHVVGAAVSPDDGAVALAVTKPRDVIAGDANGPADVHLHMAFGPGDSRPYVTGEVAVSRLSWAPDGSRISFLAKRGEDKRPGLYAIARDGGEAQRLYMHDAPIADYVWSPDGEGVWIVAAEEERKNAQDKALAEKGFDANIVEEGVPFAKVWRVDLDDEEPGAEDLRLPGHASDVEVSADGTRLAVALAPTPFVDDSFMSRRIHIVDAADGDIITEIETPGKIGAFAFSPTGDRLAFLAAVDRADPTAGTLMIADAATGEYEPVDAEAEAHVMDLAWRDESTVVALRHRSTASELALFSVDGALVADVAHEGFVAHAIDIDPELGRVALIADAPAHPRELLAGALLGPMETWTDHNAWLSDIALAEQSVVTYEARDGVMVEGVLITPRGRAPRGGWPLIMVVHGGPEAHDSNGWLTRYSSPGQIGAGDGFAVFYPNYRGSTGRGTAFAKLDHADPPGDEFFDLVDAIAALAEDGLVNPQKVGITGGSYGGFASAWGATIASEHFAASVAFVSLTNLVSFGGTTDIPVEMVDVHFMKQLWEDWDLFLTKSPVYHADASRTPTLILHGEADPRVHPAQSLELYRHLNQRGEAPVRLVTYPGEGHGNRKAAARYDYAMRLMRWMTHYLKGPGGEPPAPDLGLAEKLGIEDEND